MMDKLVVGLAILAALSSVGLAGVHSFPSEDSTLGGGIGVIGTDQIGYFYSATRGDLVQETFADPLPSVGQAIFDFDVTSSSLIDPEKWDVLINSVVVGDFSIPEDYTGPMHLDLLFAPVANIGGQYTVAFVVAEDVPSGHGSTTLGYTGDHLHTVELLPGGSVVPTIPAPGALLLGGIGAGLVGWLRRRTTL